ncbi:MAG: prolyl-tRNA synthetase associated domain-containing protein [Bacteroidetes bacterium]|nr:prolyl-tRNA synthetase associated domain-containing protein [Bacteroidota bacterium]
MRGDDLLYKILLELNISFDYYEHQPAYTVEDALKNWKYIDSTHCKNLFLRNHKGDRHYLIIMEYSQPLAIHDMEQRLKQGKLSFASPERLKRYLGVTQGAVSIFGLIHDKEHHVHVFVDENLQKAEKISFHPNDNTASIVISYGDFIKFINWSGNGYEFIRLV